MNFNVRELTIENIGKWPKPIKIGVILILSLVVLGLGYYLFIGPTIEKYNTLVVQETKLKVEFEGLQQKATNLDAYRNQMKIMNERFGAMLRQLPTQNEMPGLLEDISKTGIASGLTFVLFAPSPEILHDFYIELPIQMIVIGNYHQLAVFLSRVAEMNRIVTLHELVLEQAPVDKNKTVQGEQLVMKITATIYRYRTK